MPAANVAQFIDSRNHCPFKCEKQNLDEHGYCAHMAGFTNRGKLIEELWYDIRGTAHVGGNQIVNDVENGAAKTQVSKVSPVLKGDILVNPEKLQIDEQGQHMMKEWVSARVYRKRTDAEIEEWRAMRTPFAGEEAEDEIQLV